MFHHVALLRLTDAADADFHARIQQFCRRVRAEVPDVLAFDFGRNLADHHLALHLRDALALPELCRLHHADVALHDLACFGHHVPHVDGRPWQAGW